MTRVIISYYLKLAAPIAILLHELLYDRVWRNLYFTLIKNNVRIHLDSHRQYKFKIHVNALYRLYTSSKQTLPPIMFHMTKV